MIGVSMGQSCKTSPSGKKKAGERNRASILTKRGARCNLEGSFRVSHMSEDTSPTVEELFQINSPHVVEPQREAGDLADFEGTPTTFNCDSEGEDQKLLTGGRRSKRWKAEARRKRQAAIKLGCGTDSRQAST